MKSQIAHTTKGPIEYIRVGSGPVVLVCHGTSCNCFSTSESDPLAAAGFTGHFYWIGPDFVPISQKMVEFLLEK